MLRDKRAVIFDLDGSLIDSMWVWSKIEQEFFERRGEPFPVGLNEAIEGMSFTETAEYFKETFHLEKSVDELKDEWNREALHKYENDVPFKPGGREFLEKLKQQGIRMGIASSNSLFLIDAFLNANDAGDYFDAITTSCEVQIGKPAPDVYLITAEKLHVKPEECLVFEDVPMGIMAGKNAGMTVCAVDDAYSENLREEKRALADYYINDYEELL